MAADIRVAGVEAMKLLAKELEKAGRRDLKVELKKEAQRFTRDNRIREDIAESARDTLPGGGGFVRKPRRRGKRRDGTPRVGRPRSSRKARKPKPLNEVVAKAKVKTVANFSGRRVGVYITGSQAKKGGRLDLNSINKGKVRHPTFGHGPMVFQRVQPGYFDRPLEGEVADRFRRHVLAAINTIRRQVASAGGGRRAA